MPQNKNSPKPPLMTWGGALPVLAVSFVFDALRFLFEQFWFFGPALAGLYCTSKISGALTSLTAGTLGAGTAATACTATAGIVGFYGVAVIEMFGAIMAMAVGLFGWLAVGLIILTTNSRIFKETSGNTLWFIGSLLISEIPIIGSIPGFTGVTIKMYSAQIKQDKEMLKKWEKDQEDAKVQEQQQQITELMQAQTNQQEPDEI